MIFLIIWKEKSGKAATEVKLIDIGIDEIFLERRGIKEMKIRIQRESCRDIMKMVDKTKKILKYRAEESLINEQRKEREMKIWIIDLTEKNMIIERDGLESMRSTINWDKGILELDTVKIEKILRGLKDLAGIFKDFLEEKLSSERSEIDHTIQLIQDQISMSLLISEKVQDHQFIREYLDEMIRKNWIRFSNSPIEILIFLISKSGERRPVVDYRKLNSVIIKNSTILSLIKDTMNQIQEVK